MAFPEPLQTGASKTHSRASASHIRPKRVQSMDSLHSSSHSVNRFPEQPVSQGPSRSKINPVHVSTASQPVDASFKHVTISALSEKSEARSLKSRLSIQPSALSSGTHEATRTLARASDIASDVSPRDGNVGGSPASVPASATSSASAIPAISRTCVSCACISGACISHASIGGRTVVATCHERQNQSQESVLIHIDPKSSVTTNTPMRSSEPEHNAYPASVPRRSQRS